MEETAFNGRLDKSYQDLFSPLDNTCCSWKGKKSVYALGIN